MDERDYVEFLLSNYRELRSKISLARMDFNHRNLDDENDFKKDYFLGKGEALKKEDELPSLTSTSERLSRISQSKRAEKRKIIDNLEYELDRLENAINLLKDPYKKMMGKRFLQGLTGRTIAITLNFSESSVSRYLSQGKKLLMRMW